MKEERDRFIQSQGLKIFHYTGKEITDDPFRVAGEIFLQVVGRRPNCIG